jgi:hypothetical protein
MSKTKRATASACYCRLPEPSFCGECEELIYGFNADEVEDILSALTFFQREYSDRKGSVHTRRAMTKIEKRIWKMKRAFQ